MWRALLLVAGGCYHHIDYQGDAAAADVPPIGDSAQYCFHPTGLFQICVDQVWATFDTPVDGKLDTNVPANCTATPSIPGRGTELCVIAADKITISGTLHSFGSRPLVFLARAGGISVPGYLDVDSHAAEPGAGGTATCPGGTVGSDEAIVGDGAGGGAGGSFQTKGGDGGSNGGLTSGGTPANQADIVTFGAGVNGGSGGNTLPTKTGGGSCGLGAGAVYLYSESMLAVTGGVTAFGLGGRVGTATGAGGGGGGSGGMIVLEASAVLTSPASTVIAATGGGGAGGTGTNGSGGNGFNATVTTAATPAGGGSSVYPAGAGGGGSTGPTAAVAGAPAAMSGGGGGGGGAGVIRVIPAGQPLMGVIYPTAT